MKNIKVITDEDFGEKNKVLTEPRIKFASRGIVVNNDGKIAILHKRFKNEYKLVGGGIEGDETPVQAFKREVLEEAGCNVESIEELGTIEEVKSYANFKQISHVFVAHVKGDIGQTNFTEQEKEDGSQILWIDFDDAITIIKETEKHLFDSVHTNIYHLKFIIKRDYEILKYYKENFK